MPGFVLVRSGDREELQRFFADNYMALFGVALVLTDKHHHDASELLGATAEKLAKSWPRIRGDNPFPFATSVMRNAWNDTIRRKKARPPETVLDLRADAADATNPADTVIARQQVQDVLQSLSAEEWQVMSLRISAPGRPTDEMTFADIAHVLHMSETKVRNIWHRVIRRLDDA